MTLESIHMAGVVLTIVAIFVFGGALSGAIDGGFDDRRDNRRDNRN